MCLWTLPSLIPSREFLRTGWFERVNRTVHKAPDLPALTPLPVRNFKHLQMAAAVGLVWRVGCILFSLDRKAATIPSEVKTMTSLTKNTTIGPATLLVAASVAKAATTRAEVPFAFQVNGSMLPAGPIGVHWSGGSVQQTRHSEH